MGYKYLCSKPNTLDRKKTTHNVSLLFSPTSKTCRTPPFHPDTLTQKARSYVSPLPTRCQHQHRGIPPRDPPPRSADPLQAGDQAPGARPQPGPTARQRHRPATGPWTLIFNMEISLNLTRNLRFLDKIHCMTRSINFMKFDIGDCIILRKTKPVGATRRGICPIG